MGAARSTNVIELIWTSLLIKQVLLVNIADATQNYGRRSPEADAPLRRGFGRRAAGHALLVLARCRVHLSLSRGDGGGRAVAGEEGVNLGCPRTSYGPRYLLEGVDFCDRRCGS